MPAPTEEQQPRWFATTHWSVVLQAGSGDETRASEALAKLCQSYWNPVNQFMRRRGNIPADAEDFTQEFFLRFLTRQHYRLADNESLNRLLDVCLNQRSPRQDQQQRRSHLFEPA